MTNSEVWYNVKEKHLEILEGLDEMFLRKIFKGQSKTALEAFYLEGGIIAVRFILAKRKLMYLWTILRRPEEEMLKKVFNVQQAIKTPGDWALKIKEDLEKYEIDITDEEIKNMSK